MNPLKHTLRFVLALFLAAVGIGVVYYFLNRSHAEWTSPLAYIPSSATGVVELKKAEAFAEAIRQGEDVVAVCIGVTMPGSLSAAQATIGAIRKVVPRDLPILVGGAGVASDEIARDLGADRRSGSVYELIEVLGEVAHRS